MFGKDFLSLFKCLFSLKVKLILKRNFFFKPHEMNSDVYNSMTILLEIKISALPRRLH